MKSEFTEPRTKTEPRRDGPSHTKIIATIGPASEDKIGALIDSHHSLF